MDNYFCYNLKKMKIDHISLYEYLVKYTRMFVLNKSITKQKIQKN